MVPAKVVAVEPVQNELVRAVQAKFADRVGSSSSTSLVAAMGSASITACPAAAASTGSPIRPVDRVPTAGAAGYRSTAVGPGS